MNHELPQSPRDLAKPLKYILTLITALLLAPFGELHAAEPIDDMLDQERFGFKMPVSYSSNLGENWNYEASEFPVMSNTQRPVLLRLNEGPIVLCSFTDQARDLKKGLVGKGMTFKSIEGDFTGVGLFAAVSFDEGQTGPIAVSSSAPKKRMTNANGSLANTNGYLAITQVARRRIQLITSSKQYVFNSRGSSNCPPHEKMNHNRTMKPTL